MTESTPRAVAIATAADTVTAAIGCVASLKRALPPWCDIVIAYSAAPSYVDERVRAAAGNRPITLLNNGTWHSQNEARNRAIAAAPGYDYYFLLDLDSRIEPGTIERFVATHRSTGADLVGGIILYDASIDFGREGMKIIHYAGGVSHFRPDADGRPGMQEIREAVTKPLQHFLEETGDQPFDCPQLEFHGMCFTRRAIDLLAPFDTELTLMEPSDAALQSDRHKLKRVLDPRIEVTYEAAAQHLCDLPVQHEQWASPSAAESVRYFARKYGLPTDGEVFATQTGWNLQHYEDVGAVPRRSFPAPVLADLRDHRFARTWPALRHQLQHQGWTPHELERVGRCHVLGSELADGLFVQGGTPLQCHLVGAASILAAYGAPPLLVETALVHVPAEAGFTNTLDGRRALANRVGSNVVRTLQEIEAQDFLLLPVPKTEEQLGLYLTSDARVLLIRLAEALELHLDGAAGPDVAPLMAHARQVLPRLGFGELLRAASLAERAGGGAPASPYRLGKARTIDAFALPDEMWVEVARFLRQTGRAGDVVAAPEEFQYLCPHLRGEVLRADPWKGFNSEAAAILHKGRLSLHPERALASVASAKPVFANAVFVVYSRTGDRVGRERAVHVDAIRRTVAGVAR